jgi:cell division protein ZapA (FtsZ GTPase activity inhibitor)
MRKTSVTALVMFLAILLVACAAKDQKKVEQEMKQPINCATAQGDIRMLEHEKAHVAQEVAEGVTAIFPAGLVVGLVSGTEEEKMKVSTGEYNKMIDKRIAEIKEKCGVE